jgi:hypothetical protein
VSETNQPSPGDNVRPNPPSSAETFRQKIVDALNEVLVLHVTTVIGKAKVTNADRSGAVSTVTLDDDSPHIANTVVNTLIGDSTTIYTPDFLSDQLLVTMHKDAVQTAHNVRKDTIDMLKTVLEDFKDVLSPKPGS